MFMHITTIMYKKSDKVSMIQKFLKVNTASGTVLGPIGIAHLELNIDDHIFVHNFIICTKLKQPLFLGLTFAQRYGIEIDWEMYGTLFLRCECKKITTSMKMTNPDQWTIVFSETPSDKTQEIDHKLHLMTNHTVTVM